MKSAIILLIFIFCMAPAIQLYGQDGDASRPVSYTVITNAGDTLSGSFERWAGDTLILRGEEGTMLRVRRIEMARLDESAIVLKEAEEQNDPVAEAFRRRPASSLILLPTAWPKPDGHPVLGVYDFAFASAAISVADLVTVSGMTSFVGLLSRDGDVYSFSMKFSPLVTEDMALAAGVTFLEGYSEHVYPVQLMHVTGSFMLGEVSLTAGFGLIRERSSKTGSVLYLGADIPVMESMRLLLEFAKPSEYGLNAYLLGAAARMQFSRLLIELGVIGDPKSSRAFIAPWFGVGVIL
ncbi:MAG: hypothetical protein WBQ23_14600 [Bacteroidota bacterium]